MALQIPQLVVANAPGVAYEGLIADSDQSGSNVTRYLILAATLTGVAGTFAADVAGHHLNLHIGGVAQVIPFGGAENTPALFAATLNAWFLANGALATAAVIAGQVVITTTATGPTAAISVDGAGSSADVLLSLGYLANQAGVLTGPVSAGLGVCRAQDDTLAKLPGAAGDCAHFQGGVVYDAMRMPVPAGSSFLGRSVPAPMTLRRKGHIWVMADFAVTQDDPVYLRFVAGTGTKNFPGAFGNAADSATCVQITRAIWASSAAAGAL